MTDTISHTPPSATAQPRKPVSRAARWRSKLVHKSALMLTLYTLVLPTLVCTVLFDYYLKVDVIVKAFYRWTPDEVLHFVGLKNFRDALADPLFWQSFKVVAIMLVANLLKMWPAIVCAIALHRLLSPRWRYIYQVLFVIPMVVPALVWLLIWKSFYDPDFGILNRVLNATGLMQLFSWLDGTPQMPGVMPRFAAALQPFITSIIDPIFGSIWALIVVGAVLLTCLTSDALLIRQRWSSYAMLIAAAATLALLATTGFIGGGLGAVLLATLALAWMIAMARTMGSGWIIWPFLLLAGLWALAHQPWRLPLLLLAALVLFEFVRRASHRFTSDLTLRWVGGLLLALGVLLVLFARIWTVPTGQFVTGTPAWLGHRDLVLPALIFWGFPWVGTVGVLIYLAALQQISAEVYEAAELDGVGPVGKLFRIELPLIMSAVRINLIFMTIGTLTSYEFFLILLGSSGGPGNVGMVPGLYMYKKAFEEGYFGYACALGMVLFVMILLLTVIYQRYVRVDK